MKKDNSDLIEELHNRERNIINSVCNIVGCKDCHLTFTDSDGSFTCQACYLNSKILDLEFENMETAKCQ